MDADRGVTGLDVPGLWPEDALEVSVTRLEGGQVLIRAIGEIDAHTAGLFEHATAGEPAPPATAVVLDLAAVTFCSTAGISTLVTIQARATACGIPLLLIPGTGIVRRTLEIMGLYTWFTMRTDVVSALAGPSDHQLR